ncbi:PREDICTED: odorant receptor Or1-like [Trachymyrmex cornetzi]|uniref:odorant receptor Or1-like n=1 Tax=Trachymyrmex cornetzi TaxID=471704 RepID=UPI00084F6915|nr:PREDICTED: odorant receptor Or1-like [Trachymyrmex cornetzi]
MLSQLMDLIMIVDNSNDFTDNFYVLLAMIVSCCKMLALLMNRSNIEMLIKTLMRKPFRPVEPDEMKIRQKFEKLIQSNTLYYTVLVETTCLSVVVTSLLTEFKKGNLTFRAWLPFDYSSSQLFPFVYAHQLISFTMGSVHHVACDSLICGFLVHICCQIEILEHRLRKSARDPNILRECILQHNNIFKFARIVNEKFRITIFIQFVVSTLVMCFNLYQFTKSTALRTKYMQLIMYTCSMLSQIFFYCWYGNEVKLKSRQLINNIFEMEWFKFNVSAQKTLLMVMRRAVVPIEFTSACVISMNLDSFVGLLKTSYSAYNILKQTQDYSTFKFLTICGCWRPDSWTSSCKRVIYHTHTFFVLVLINTFTLSQLLDIILTVDNADDFTDNFYMLLAMIVSCCKMLSMLINRKNIALLTNILTERPCRPLEPEEIEIHNKFDKGVQANTIHYAILVETTCVCITLTSLLTDFRRRTLTFRAWLPYDYSSPILFHVTYAHQLISLIIGSVLHVACDGLICGLLVHICCQIKILESRLKRIAYEPGILPECILQHSRIFDFAITVNEKFRFTIAIQFMVSTLVVCFNLYQLTRSTTTNAKYVQLVLYMCSMLTQIFFYCWYGNEVKLKSRQLVSNIFDMEWCILDQNEKKSLLLIMRRSTVPIEFTSAYIISMNLDSFVSLLKTSYSAYNILQQI